jgi:DNA-binding transcriptional LysR family regulator
LDLNDQAIKEMESAADQPEICIGVIEDLTAMVLPVVLAKLQKKSPPPHVQIRIGRHHELAKELELGKLDLVFGWEDSEIHATSYSLPHHPLVWIGSLMFQTTHWTPHNPMPLVFLTGNCPLRTQGTRALTAAGIPWKVACTSSSLDGVWAAVREGIGVTVRSALGLPPDEQNSCIARGSLAHLNGQRGSCGIAGAE